MQKINIKNLILNIVAIFFAITFLFCGIHFLNDNYSQTKNGIKAADNQSQYTLTLNIDQNFEYFYIIVNDNQIEVDIELGTYTNTFLQGTEIEFNYQVKTGYAFKQYYSYNTDDNTTVFYGISNNKFSMPSYNLTINASSVQIRTLTINKILYQSQNKQNFNTEVFSYIYQYASNATINLSADLINYHKVQINGKDFLSHNGYNNIEYLNGELKITNLVDDDTIDVYFEKNYYNCSVYFGINETADNKIGGSFDIDENDYIFAKTTVNGIISFNVYLNSDLEIKNITSNNGYRFKKVFALDQNNIEYDSSNITEIDNDKTVVIKEISTALKIYVQFQKTNQVNVSINSLLINNQQTKIGKIGFESETLTKDNLIRDIDNETSISIVTEIDNEFKKVYEFKQWEIKDEFGRVIEIAGLNEDDLKNTILTITNIDQDVYIKAVYGIKTLSVAVSWEGNGSIQSEDTISENDVFHVSYGNDIVLKLIPKDSMHFVKDPIELIKLQDQSDQDTQNIPSQQLKETYLEYKISNVTQNLKIKVIFVKNTWWEHIETIELEGKGTAEEPYKISSASDLAFASKNIYNNISASDADKVDYRNAYYILTKDIDCGHDYYFMPLGIQTNRISPNFNLAFNGTFDYQYHSVTNMWTELDVSIYQNDGLFDYLGPNAKIINRYRNYTSLILPIVGSLIAFAIVLRVVFFVERRRNKPKRVITLKNYKDINELDE